MSLDALPDTDVVIDVDHLGIEFLRGRKAKLSLREMVYRRRTTHDKSTFWALRDVTFQVGHGEAVGLVGGNGSGKSTLLKMIAGTLLPDEGSVSIDGGVAPLIELTGGFVGKWAVFAVALSAGAWPVVMVAVLSSIVAAFFYVRDGVTVRPADLLGADELRALVLRVPVVEP